MTTAPVLRVDGIGVTIGAKSILSEITLELSPGLVVALVGPNGAGKSTLLSVLSGELAPTTGTVSVGGRNLAELRHGERARLRSVLTQENAVSFPFTVREVVEMGRAPWQRRSTLLEDESAIDEAIEVTDIGHLLARRYPSLSGGEKARVSLARVLAQRTPIVLLDEPTAALDLGHQEDVMRVAQRLASTGCTVVVVLHDLSLAGAYADRIVLLHRGSMVADGAPAAALSEDLLGAVYGIEVEIVQHRGASLVVPVRIG